MKAVISAMNRFRGDLIPEDDVTLMVIKIAFTAVACHHRAGA